MNFYTKENIKKLEACLWVKTAPWNYEVLLWEKVSHHNTYFQKIPWILGIAVCNSLAMNAAHKQSDIDLFIITKRGRLWTVRILMTLLLSILWERKTSNKHAWKFCLSFFISEDGLDFTNIAIKNDIYLAYWIKTLKPIINRKNIFKKFRDVNKGLVSTQSSHPWFSSPLKEREAAESQNFIVPFSPKEEKIQDWGIYEKNQGWRDKNPIHQLLKTPQLLTYCWDICEKLLRTLFLPRTKKSFQKLWKPFWVVISDSMLKFHDRDRRKKIRDRVLSS